MPRRFEHLEQIPKELLQDVLERLDLQTLKQLNLASRWCYEVATPLIWQETTLKDCGTWTESGEYDEHDDTPLLRQLLIIAQNPFIGSCVNKLTHMCHLPPPAIFTELSLMKFSASTLSCDPRTAELVKLAVKNMPHVQTLRIIFGHPNINDALLRCFFDKHRKSSIQRLWLENCRINAACDASLSYSLPNLPLELDFSGLESIRFRRLPLRPTVPSDASHYDVDSFCNTRGRPGLYDIQDGAGATYRPSLNYVFHELLLSEAGTRAADMGSDVSDVHADPAVMKVVGDTCAFAVRRERCIYENLARDTNLPEELLALGAQYFFLDRGPGLDQNLERLSECEITNIFRNQRERKPSPLVMFHLLDSCSDTLTHLCLDWITTMPHEADRPKWIKIYRMLFSLRFPHLRSFQYRNAIAPDTALPSEFYLLDYSKSYRTVKTIETGTGNVNKTKVQQTVLYGLEFLEAHPHLQCLAWPMESFFSSRPFDKALASRVEAVIENLGRTLVDLRVDALYREHGEPQSDDDTLPDEILRRQRRRRFISDFAPKMTKLQSIKIEGSVPRDERREVIRALHQCPLDKIVMIGVCSPIGNTWGAGGRDMEQLFAGHDLGLLEGEAKDAIHSVGFKKPEAPPSNFCFRPEYGWPAGPPMLHTVASFHADTIRQMKFSGFKGALLLYTPMPITDPLLAPIKYFHKLETLTLSVWLKTEFEGQNRDDDIIKYWLDARNSATTSLVRITDEEPEGWEKEIRTRYAPDAMAWWVTTYLGQFLSEEAKGRKGGVQVRITLCIGERGGMFDLDLRIGKGSLNSDVCLGFKGPREELEPERRQNKLESRGWF